MRAGWVMLTALAMTGCGHAGQDEEGTRISLSGDNTSGKVDQTGRVNLDLPFVKGEIRLPKVALDADNFEMNGVHLYPGSKIHDLNVDTTEVNGKDAGSVRVAFDSPAAPMTVRDWLKGRLDHAGFRLRDDGTGLAGTTDDGKPFRLTLSPAASGHSNGRIIIGA